MREVPPMPEPIARLLEWRAPEHIPVPHGGIAARTYAEFKPDTPVDKRYWFEGSPLFTADQIRSRDAIWAGMLEKAVREERERCAKLAIAWGDEQIANVIRDELFAERHAG
jgi:hypothetical protein